jgi:acetolactate synthase I/II/III large subunit
MSKVNSIDGATALIRSLEEQGVEYIFGYSGGAAIPIFDALITSETDIQLILVRHEQGAAHMADGYARASGKPGVVLVTSGPGAGNIVTGLMTAHMDSVPLIAISGQQITSMLGLDAFQEADIFNITMPVTKHNYLVKNSADIPRTVKEAFYLATSGRPGPVLIDLPKDVSSSEFKGSFDEEVDLPAYRPHIEPSEEKLDKLMVAWQKAKKP